MTTPQLISKLNTMEATARLLMEEAITLRKELERIHASAPRKGKRDGLTEEERMRVAKALARRERFINEGIRKAASSN